MALNWPGRWQWVHRSVLAHQRRTADNQQPFHTWAHRTTTSPPPCCSPTQQHSSNSSSSSSSISSGGSSNSNCSRPICCHFIHEHIKRLPVHHLVLSLNNNYTWSSSRCSSYLAEYNLRCNVFRSPAQSPRTSLDALCKPKVSHLQRTAENWYRHAVWRLYAAVRTNQLQWARPPAVSKELRDIRVISWKLLLSGRRLI